MTGIIIGLAPSLTLEANRQMNRLELVIFCTLIQASTALAQSDQELLEIVRANAEKIYLEQVSFTLPESFHRSGLDPSTKEQLIARWAKDSAECHADAISAYAEEEQIPLSEIIAEDGTYGFGVGVPSDFEARLVSCLSSTWQAVGATFPE